MNYLASVPFGITARLSPLGSWWTSLSVRALWLCFRWKVNRHYARGRRGFTCLLHVRLWNGGGLRRHGSDRILRVFRLVTTTLSTCKISYEGNINRASYSRWKPSHHLFDVFYDRCSTRARKKGDPLSRTVRPWMHFSVQNTIHPRHRSPCAYRDAYSCSVLDSGPLWHAHAHVHDDGQFSPYPCICFRGQQQACPSLFLSPAPSPAPSLDPFLAPGPSRDPCRGPCGAAKR